jgi:allantoicase
MRIEPLNPLPTVGESGEAKPNRVRGDSTFAHLALASQLGIARVRLLGEVRRQAATDSDTELVTPKSGE